MNKATNIYTVYDITSINFYLGNDRQIENYGITFEYGAEKFQSKSLSFSSVTKLTEIMVSTINSKVNHSVFIMDLLNFEFLV